MSGYGYTCTSRGPDPRCNYAEGTRNLFTNQMEYGNPGYVPTLWVGILFFTVFGLSTIAHVAQGIYKRTWWCLWTFVFCGIGELCGWGGRIWMEQSMRWRPEQGGFYSFNRNAFMMQISTLIFSPAFLAAGLYWTLGLIIRVRGEQYSRFHYKTYAAVFISGDVVSLVVQATGGGMAASADTYEGAETGAKIMVGGVMGQAVIMVLYTLLLIDFVWHAQHKKPVRQLSPFAWARCWTRSKALTPAASPASEVEKHAEGATGLSYSKRKVALQLAALCFATLVIFIRSIFRAIELLDGWTGPLVKNQTLFIVLDGMMVSLAMLSLNACHPGWLLPRVYRKPTDAKRAGPEAIAA